MKVAIAGKDDEQFPGDVEDATVQKATLAEPSQLLQKGSAPALRPQVAGSAAISVAKPVASTVSLQGSATRSAVGQLGTPGAAWSQPRAVSPVVKPAMTPAPALQKQTPAKVSNPNR